MIFYTSLNHIYKSSSYIYKQMLLLLLIKYLCYCHCLNNLLLLVYKIAITFYKNFNRIQTVLYDL